MQVRSDVKRAVQDLVEHLKGDYNPEIIILFGSYAYGEPDSESDIDLLIVKRTPLPFHKRWVEVCQLVSGDTKGLEFSPFVVTPEELEIRLAMGDQFFKEILARGEILYAR